MIQELISIASAALETGKFEEFEVALQHQELPDSFSLLLSPQITGLLAKELESDSVTEWITRPQTWDISTYNPQIEFSSGETILPLLWQDLDARLKRKLQAASQHISVASHGAIVCFFGTAALSIIVRYQRSSGAFALQPITAIERPQGVFELEDIFSSASPEQRNAIKAAALSIDKILFQRGVLVHVDRQREDVFGPSIDTVLLAELLAEWIDTRQDDKGISALEIGCGNGLLCTLLASAEKVSRVYAVDMNPAAAICTLKNLRINSIALDALCPETSVRAERFRPLEMAKSVDLIVCNPPYVPEPPPEGGAVADGYDLAVTGLDLCRNLLCSLDLLLRPGGRLLLMTSSLSSEEVRGFIPTGFEFDSALEGNGRRVPLDLDVLWRREDWRDQLIRDDRVEADEAGVIWHYLKPLWVFRKEGVRT